MRKPGFPTRSDTNWAVQSQKMARGLKFWIEVIEGLYYLYSENKGADQLRSYCAADLRLCFRICKKPVFSERGSFELLRDKNLGYVASKDSDQPRVFTVCRRKAKTLSYPLSPQQSPRLI